MKMSVNWCQAVLACLLSTAGTGTGYGQITNWVATFNSSADTALWSHQSGDSATDYISFLAGDAPPGQTNSSGCMVLQCAFGPSLTWTVIGKNVHGINVSNCTALELDVKVDPAQAVFDTFGNACNSFEITLGCGSSDTWFTTDTGAITPIAAYNGWEHIVVPASAFAGYIQGVNTNWANVQWVLIEPVDGYFPITTNMVLRIANVKFTAPAPIPANPTISVNASNTVRTADARWFGINTGNYDYDFNLQHTIPEANEAGWTTLRYPGGSTSDAYHWAHETQLNNTYAHFAQVATNLGANVIITANYGTGTPAEAAGWVADANVTNHYDFKYWEIGNEVYATGTEIDSNTPAHDPYTYASRAAQYIQQMKAVDPAIKIGVVVVKGEQLDNNGYTNHPAINLVTGQAFTGWTPVVMSTLRQLGVAPDFAIYHYYPENYPSSPDNDQKLLVMNNWADDAAELRGEINDFFGPAGTNIEILITENNNDAGNPGKQSVSLVNALYYADSLGQIMQTEFNARIWWQLHDGGPPYTTGDMNANLYGWRPYGAFGLMDWQNGLVLTNRYPPFFAAKLIHHFIGGGDKVVSVSSDLPLVSAYAALRTNGDLTLMLINKSATSNYLANIGLTNYMPGSTATVYSYGMPQDNAAKAGDNNCDITTNAYSVSANFNYTLAPYSINVIDFSSAPAAPLLSVLPLSESGQFVFQLAGQSGSYVLQTSTNLSDWTTVATNTLTNTVLNVTNPISSETGVQFWRAVQFQ
ncbi:MAG TPA: hypothetical protein VHG89_08445 [Verrucomicrobiae bacterium]|nr:hypothetical protein [Verrucomicrobiae bacterium]